MKNVVCVAQMSLIGLSLFVSWFGLWFIFISKDWLPGVLIGLAIVASGAVGVIGFYKGLKHDH